MSKFDSYYTLCPIHDPKEFLGIAVDRDENNIITTLDKNVIIIIKISSHTQITSWSIKDKLSAKVVFDCRSQQYVGVFGGEALRCWDETTKDINKVKKLKFNKKIVDLVSSAEDTYVLYSDGKAELLAIAIEMRKLENDSNSILEHVEKKIIYKNAKVFTLNNGQNLLTYFEVKEVSGADEQVNLVCVPIENGAGKNPIRFNLQRNSADNKLVGYAIVDGDDAPRLATIWSDKRLFLMKINGSANPDDAPGKLVSIIPSLKTDSPISVIGVSQQCIVIYAANNSQDGASLMLYNTQFKILKSTQFFKVFFDFSRLWSIREYIILAMGQNLAVVSYHMVKETLADLLGCQASNCIDQPVGADLINEDEYLQDSLEYAGSTRTNGPHLNSHHLIESRPYYENKSRTELCADGKTIPYESMREFDCELSALKRLQMDVEVVVSSRPEINNSSIVLMSNAKEKGFITPEIQHIVEHLENCGASEHEITEKLLTLLINADLFEEIETTLRRYRNISEYMISKTVSHISKAILKSGEKGASEDMTETELYKRILYLLISLPFDNAALAISVRHELQYEEVLHLLQHLYELLADAKTNQQMSAEPEFDCLAFEIQVLKWLGMLLDAYFQKLALSNDMRIIESVYQWSKLLDSYKEELQDLNELSSIMHGILEQKQKPKDEHDYSQWYTIEEVFLY